MNNDFVRTVWQKQRLWSAASDALKKNITRTSTAVLILGSSGAILATLSTQVTAGPAQKIIAWMGAAFLSIIPVLTYRLLTPSNTRAWIRARSASEGLKAESFYYAAKAAPYDGDGAMNILGERTQKIEDSVQDLMMHATLVKPDDSEPPILADSEEYIANRISEQIDNFYLPKSRKNATNGRRFRIAEFYLAIATAMLAAAAGVWGADGTIAIGSWVAVLTTIGGTLTAHINASRFEYLATSYLATARRLEDLRSQWTIHKITLIPSPEWSNFVHKCEEAISVENESWMAKWTKEDGKE